MGREEETTQEVCHCRSMEKRLVVLLGMGEVVVRAETSEVVFTWNRGNGRDGINQWSSKWVCKVTYWHVKEKLKLLFIFMF